MTILPHATSVGNKRKQTEDRNTFFISNIVSIASFPSKKIDKKKITQLRIYFNKAYQVYIVRKKFSTKCGHLIAQVQNTAVKWSIKQSIVWTKKAIKAMIQKLVEWIIKNSNVRESPIARDNLLITVAEFKVKRRVLKILLECSMWHLHDELIASQDDWGLK